MPRIVGWEGEIERDRVLSGPEVKMVSRERYHWQIWSRGRGITTESLFVMAWVTRSDTHSKQMRDDEIDQIYSEEVHVASRSSLASWFSIWLFLLYAMYCATLSITISYAHVSCSNREITQEMDKALCVWQLYDFSTSTTSFSDSLRRDTSISFDPSISSPLASSFSRKVTTRIRL